MGAVVGHCVLSRHARHSFPTQNGVGAAHAESEVHPLVQRLSPLQTGAEDGQSPCERQVTQRPSPMRQNGAAVPQWLCAVHATHCLLTGSHSGRLVPAQSPSPMQPTHWPVTVSHFGESPGQLPAVHVVRHW
jgi:hypothetical protein